MLSLPTFSLLGCFLILCHYFKLLEPVTTFEDSSEKFGITSRIQVSSPVSTTKMSAGGSSKAFKGRRSPVPKPLSEVELKSHNSSWVDWIWWTAFNFSISKFIIESRNLSIMTSVITLPNVPNPAHDIAFIILS